MEQVSILAFGVAGRFWDLPEEERVASLAVAMAMRTEEGARTSILPVTFAGLATAWNDTRPKKKKAGVDPVAAFVGGAGR